MIGHQEEEELKSDQDIWSGRMSRGHSQATKEKTSDASLKKSVESQMQKFLFLDLRKKKWSGQGAIMGDGYSVAWRTLDAQYWGVPQRRKRIYLVADFGGESAPQILFEQNSLRGNIEESSKERKDTATGAEDGSYKSDGANDECLNNSIKAFHITQDPISMKISPCLTQGNSNTGQATIGVIIPVMDKASRYKSQKTANGFGVGDEDDPSYTLTTADRHSIDRAAFNQGINAKYDIDIAKDIAQTIVAKGPGAVEHETYAMQSFGEYKYSGKASSIKQRDFKDATDLVVAAFEPRTVSRVGGHCYEDGKSGTIRANPRDNQQAIISEYIVRRLTPMECGRLQGFPDGWTAVKESDGKPLSDTQRYKMLGNAMTVPVMRWIGERIKAQEIHTQEQAALPADDYIDNQTLALAT